MHVQGRTLCSTEQHQKYQIGKIDIFIAYTYWIWYPYSILFSFEQKQLKINSVLVVCIKCDGNAFCNQLKWLKISIVILQLFTWLLVFFPSFKSIRFFLLFLSFFLSLRSLFSFQNRSSFSISIVWLMVVDSVFFFGVCVV